MNTGPDRDGPDRRADRPRDRALAGQRRRRDEPGEGTALGVFHGIRAACRHAFGSDDLADRTVLVQGAGAVGGAADRPSCREAGARVFAVATSTRRGVAATGAGPVDGRARRSTTPCDVLAPCATGGVLNAETIPALACRVVAGAANNQLATAEDGERLAGRAASCTRPTTSPTPAACIWLAGYETLGWDRRADARRGLAGIEDTLGDVFDAGRGRGGHHRRGGRRLARARIDGRPRLGERVFLARARVSPTTSADGEDRARDADDSHQTRRSPPRARRTRRAARRSCRRAASSQRERPGPPPGVVPLGDQHRKHRQHERRDAGHADERSRGTEAAPNQSSRIHAGDQQQARPTAAHRAACEGLQHASKERHRGGASGAPGRPRSGW